MIGYLSGTVIDTNPGRTLIDVSGVGYIVYATSNCLHNCIPQQEQSLYIHTVVREQSLDLYGFIQEQEKTVV